MRHGNCADSPSSSQGRPFDLLMDTGLANIDLTICPGFGRHLPMHFSVPAPHYQRHVPPSRPGGSSERGDSYVALNIDEVLDFRNQQNGGHISTNTTQMLLCGRPHNSIVGQKRRRDVGIRFQWVSRPARRRTPGNRHTGTRVDRNGSDRRAVYLGRGLFYTPLDRIA
jgi:hypothetical protein